MGYLYLDYNWKWNEEIFYFENGTLYIKYIYFEQLFKERAAPGLILHI